MHMIAHRSRDTDAARRTFSLKSRCYIYRIAMQVGAVGNRVSNVDPDAETDSSGSGLLAIIGGHLLLYLHCAAHGSINAVEYDKEGVATGLNNLAAMLLNRRVNQVPA